MENLSNRQKVALARQFNLIVRSINDFQLAHWAERNAKEFDELVRKEREILLNVERLLDRTTHILADEPSTLILDVENFSEDLRLHLRFCKLDQAIDLCSRAVILVSSILGIVPNLENGSKANFFELYVA